MKHHKLLLMILLLAIFGGATLLLYKSANAQNTAVENATILNEFKKAVPAVQQGRKSISIYHGEKMIQSEIREIEFGDDYFMVRDSVWNGRNISIRRMYIKTSEIIWMVEDEAAIVLKLKN